MIDYLFSFLNLFLSSQHQLILMFLSAFLSATILPGNSEVMFTLLAGKILISQQAVFSTEIINLLLIATLGNSLGSFTTFYLGKLFPRPSRPNHQYAQWAFKQSQKYGEYILLLSWLPILGDLLCVAAGWLRLDSKRSLIFITLGKLFRYFLLLATLYPIMKFVL